MTSPSSEASQAALDELLAAIAEPSMEVAFAVTERLTRDSIGCRLYTVMTSNPEAGYAARIYSSDPAHYPVSGRKPIVANSWTRTVLDGKQPFVANTIDAIAEVFPDHPLIASLGCGSCLNVPVIVAGQVRGTVNILDETGHFTPKRIADAMALRPFYAVALLAALQTNIDT